ncbi:MAG: molybdate ABC transporter permease subunit [Candidatus Poribacteria bacterium]|nr:molybdate ABC transporter permease subunit [Candidatus Poribacteria bacterium]
MNLRLFEVFIILNLFLLFLPGCRDDRHFESEHDSGEAEKPTRQGELVVFAAISLTDALSEISKRFRLETGIQIHCNFTGSSTLQQQIEKGANTDIFICASPMQMDSLETQKRVHEDTRRNLLTNSLVLIAPLNGIPSASDPRMLVTPPIERIAIAEPHSVPAGIYGREALLRLGIWEDVQSKFILGTDVRSTLAYVESGEVDVGIVYKTDAAISKSVKAIYQFPSSSHSPIVYPAAVMKTTNRKALAQVFLAYLNSSEATGIFESNGFSMVQSVQRVSDGVVKDVERGTSDRLWTIKRAEVDALILSVKVAILSLVFIFPPGLFVSWAFAKNSFRGKSFLNTIVMVPLVLPPVVSGYFLLMLFSRAGPLGSILYRLLGREVIFSWAAVVLAISVISFPLFVRSAVTAMEGVSPKLESAARTLGAHPLKVFFTVTLPLSYRGIVGGGILAFSKSLGEFGATMMVAGNIPGKTQTLSLAIFNYFTIGWEASAYRLVLISTLISFVTLWIAERQCRRLSDS